jgi:hypothetical protein
MWCKDAGLAEFPLTWQEAQKFVDKMNQSKAFGFCNWRLPSRRELLSLVSHQHINPCLPKGHPFINVFPGYYWTQNECSRLSDEAWYVHMGGGRVFRGMKHGSYMIWPVNGLKKQFKSDETRFVLNDPSNSIFDRYTGLIWQRHANPTGRPVDWQTALEVIRDYNSETKTVEDGGWRLPNIRELESLVSLDCHSPALSAGMPVEDVQAGYWSSTTSAYEPSYAWVLYLRDGEVGVGYKGLPEFSVWAVKTDKY